MSPRALRNALLLSCSVLCFSAMTVAAYAGRSGTAGACAILSATALLGYIAVQQAGE